VNRLLQALKKHMTALFNPCVLSVLFFSLFFCQVHDVDAHEALRVYELDSSSRYDVIFTYQEGQLFFGNDGDEERVIYRFKKNKLYRVVYVDSKKKENCLYTFTDHRIYRGDSTKEEDCLFTFYQGKIYNSYALKKENILYTFFEGQVYRGYSDEKKDVLYRFEDRKIFRGSQSDNRLYYFQAKKDDWYRVYYTSSKQAVFTFTRLTNEHAQYPCSRMKHIRMLGLIDFLPLGLIDSPWSMIYFGLQMNDAVTNCMK